MVLGYTWKGLLLMWDVDFHKTKRDFLPKPFK